MRQRFIGFTCALQSAFGVERDDGIDGRIVTFDVIELRAQHFNHRDFAGADGLCSSEAVAKGRLSMMVLMSGYH